MPLSGTKPLSAYPVWLFQGHRPIRGRRSWGSGIPLFLALLQFRYITAIGLNPDMTFLTTELVNSLVPYRVNSAGKAVRSLAGTGSVERFGYESISFGSLWRWSK